MKIRIETPIATIKANLSEEYVAEILARTLDYACGTPNEAPAKAEPKSPVLITPHGSDEPSPTRNPKVPEPPTKIEFKGFLYLKCDKCGKFKGFMPKNPISRYRCNCGHTSVLKDMRVMRVDCKCGQKFKYLTNAKDSTISIDCFTCGSPIDLEYHERKQEYVTMTEEVN